MRHSEMQKGGSNLIGTRSLPLWHFRSNKKSHVGQQANPNGGRGRTARRIIWQIDQDFYQRGREEKSGQEMSATDATSARRSLPRSLSLLLVSQSRVSEKNEDVVWPSIRPTVSSSACRLPT